MLRAAGFVLVALLSCLACGQHGLADEAADSSKLEVTVVIPKEVPTVAAGQTLQLMLFEYDPFLADAAADKFDELKVKDFAHTVGTETKKTFTLGEKVNGGKICPRRKYYLVTDIVDAEGKRTHYGDCSHRKGLCSVLTGEFPKQVEVKLRKLN